MKNQLVFFFALLALPSFAQTPLPERVLDFTAETTTDGHKFSPIMPELIQKPGAPKAYWSYFWEFGDGNFSREANPVHSYNKPGDYEANLDATAYYDDGKRAKRKKKNTNSQQRMAGTTPLNDVFDPKGKQMIAMNSYCKPKAEEEITLVISYRNLGQVSTDGRLHLFYNEKKYPAKHFAFVEARTPFGETPDMSTSQVLPTAENPMEAWTALPQHSSGGHSIQWEEPPSSILDQLLSNARGTYREEQAWRFNQLQQGEKRNMFISLAGTPDMLRDTNAFIHLEGIFAPFDPAVPPERFVYEIEIVSSHDPNAIAVSDNRVSYRTIGSKKLDYKIQFQNNGEGPASKVEVRVDVPKGLKMKQMQPISWYPKCPICPKVPDTRGCLDTATLSDALVFTFRNIYLPGSRQDDVDNRDSTKGFVKYRITAKRGMPKYAFKSRAKIVFDKNSPIYTNYTTTRFKVGISPGIKIGYGFEPSLGTNDDPTSEESTSFVQDGYIFLGASLSPYKSWRIYPQVELISGIRGRSALPPIRPFTTTTEIDSLSTIDIRVFAVDSISRTGDRGFISFEVPVLLRKNFSRGFGMGLGGAVKVLLENGKFIDVVNRRIYMQVLGNDPEEISQTFESVTTPFKNTLLRYSLFADITVGSVRAGPNLGIRGGMNYGTGAVPTPFVQVSLELKL
jgi:PKD repeat protein